MLHFYLLVTDKHLFKEQNKSCHVDTGNQTWVYNKSIFYLLSHLCSLNKIFLNTSLYFYVLTLPSKWDVRDPFILLLQKESDKRAHGKILMTKQEKVESTD